MDKKKLKNNIQGVIIGISLTLAGINILDSAGYNINLVHPIKNVISSKEDDDCKNDEIIEEKIYIKNIEQLNEYIKNKPTFSEIREAIEENDTLSNDDKTKEDIKADEFVKKYKLLLKACLNTKNNKSYSYIYEIEKLLYDSYSKYRKKFPNEVSVLKEIIHNEVVEKIKNENDIKINNEQGETITYSNFDNLYLIYNDIDTGRFKYIIGEKYFFHAKKQYHVDKDNFTEEFVNDTLLYDENYNPKVISIKKLINQYGNGRKQYAYEDICNMHKNSMKKKVKKIK